MHGVSTLKKVWGRQLGARSDIMEIGSRGNQVLCANPHAYQTGKMHKKRGLLDDITLAYINICYTWGKMNDEYFIILREPAYFYIQKSCNTHSRKNVNDDTHTHTKKKKVSGYIYIRGCERISTLKSYRCNRAYIPCCNMFHFSDNFFMQWYFFPRYL